MCLLRKYIISNIWHDEVDTVTRFMQNVNILQLGLDKTLIHQGGAIIILCRKIAISPQPNIRLT